MCAGVALSGAGSETSLVSRNSMFGNASPGIVETGSTFAAAPVITRISTGIGDVTVEGNAPSGSVLEFYLPDTASGSAGQGKTFLVARVVDDPNADSNSAVGSFRFTIPIPGDPTADTTGVRVLADTIGILSAGTLQPGASSFGNADAAAPGAVFGAPAVTAGPDQTILEGQQFSGHGSFSDFDSSSWTAQVNYGDGTGWQTLKLNPATSATQNSDAYTAGSAVSFDLSHVYAKAGTYSVSIQVIDDSQKMGIDALTVNVQNTAPVIDNTAFHITDGQGNTLTRISEGGSVTVTGVFTDTGSSDTHTATIIWGDGTVSGKNGEPAATVDEVAHTFTATHTYRANPVGATAGEYALQATVTDLGGNGTPSSTTSGLFYVEVDNIKPAGLTLTPTATTISEGDAIGLVGAFSDPGVLDGHRVAISWGDGSPDTIINLDRAVTSFNAANHQYFNNPASPNTSYAVSVSVIDLDEPLAPTTAATTITVANVAPTLIKLALDKPAINENDTATLSGIVGDVGVLDSHNVTIHWGDGSPDRMLHLDAGVKNFSAPHQYLNNPAGFAANGAFPISVTVTDSDGASTSGTASIIVNDAAATVTAGSLQLTTLAGTAIQAAGVNEGDTVVLTGAYADPGTLDNYHSVTINWGDGKSTTVAAGEMDRTFTAKHAYVDNPVSGTTYTISASVTDDDNLAGPALATALRVNNVAPTVQVLAAAGSTATSVHLISTVTDPGASDTFTYAWTVVVDGTPTQTGSGPDFSFSPPPARSDGTVPTSVVTLTVTDTRDTTSFTTTKFEVIALSTAGTSADQPYHYVAADPAPADGIGSMMILGLNTNQVADASHVNIPVTLEALAGLDTLLGGTAADTLVMTTNNDYADGGKNSDHYLISADCTMTIVDGVGDNTIDFGITTYGVTFDLRQTGGQLQNVDPTHSTDHVVSINDLHSPQSSQAMISTFDTNAVSGGTGRFSTLDGSALGDTLTAASNSTVNAGAGNDSIMVRGGTAGGAMISGGAGDDVVTLGGTDTFTTGTALDTTIGSIGGTANAAPTVIGPVVFNGDDGANLLTNTAPPVIGTGSAASPGVTSITFNGGSDADQLLNQGSVGAIQFNGGLGHETVTNASGASAGSITFKGDDGANLLVNAGTVGTTPPRGAGVITFGGGSDADQLINTGTAGTIQFNGGLGNDKLINTGNAGTIIFNGDDGANMFVNGGSAIQQGNPGQITVAVGARLADRFQRRRRGEPAAPTGSVGSITFTSGANGGTLSTPATPPASASTATTGPTCSSTPRRPTGTTSLAARHRQRPGHHLQRRRRRRSAAQRRHRRHHPVHRRQRSTRPWSTPAPPAASPSRATTARTCSSTAARRIQPVRQRPDHVGVTGIARRHDQLQRRRRGQPAHQHRHRRRHHLHRHHGSGAGTNMLINAGNGQHASPSTATTGRTCSSTPVPAPHWQHRRRPATPPARPSPSTAVRTPTTAQRRQRRRHPVHWRQRSRDRDQRRHRRLHQLQRRRRRQPAG